MLAQAIELSGIDLGDLAARYANLIHTRSLVKVVEIRVRSQPMTSQRSGANLDCAKRAAAQLSRGGKRKAAGALLRQAAKSTAICAMEETGLRRERPRLSFTQTLDGKWCSRHTKPSAIILARINVVVRLRLCVAAGYASEAPKLPCGRVALKEINSERYLTAGPSRCASRVKQKQKSPLTFRGGLGMLQGYLPSEQKH